MKYASAKIWPSALATLCLLTALLVQLPASLLAERLNRSCASHCQLAQATGFWWSGQARLYLRSTRNSGQNDDWFDLGPLHWSIHWGAPLRLAVRVAGGEAALDAGWQTRTLTARQLTLPAAWLLSQPGLPLPGDNWSGEIVVSALSLRIADPSRWESEGRLAWAKAASRLLPDLPPASLHLEWQLDSNNGGEARLHSAPDDPLAIAATIRFAAGPKADVIEASFTPTPATPASVRHQLATIAQPDPAQAGRYRLKHHFR